MELDPDQLDLRQRYKLLIGCVVPRPIAFVSTISPAGQLNLAPFSFFNGLGSNPLTVLFCPVNQPDGTDKDTQLVVAWTQAREEMALSGGCGSNAPPPGPATVRGKVVRIRLEQLN